MSAGPASTRVRWLVGAAGALAYAAASHALMTRAGDSAWALAVVLGPVVVLGAGAAWGAGHRWLALAGAVAAILLALQLLNGNRQTEMIPGTPVTAPQAEQQPIAQ